MVGFPQRTSLPTPPASPTGRIVAPLFTWLARLRHGRPLHPDGVCVMGEAVAIREPGRALSGPVLVRLSPGLWRGRRAKPDALGVAIRFGTSRSVRRTGELDLLFGTFRSVAALPFAPITTDTRDFFANPYWAVVPFDIEGLGRCHLRLSPLHRAGAGEDRTERLLASIADGRAGFVLEARTDGSWRPLARIDLTEALDHDVDALGFEPWAAARGVVPVGALAGVRREVYGRVQRVRRGF